MEQTIIRKYNYTIEKLSLLKDYLEKYKVTEKKEKEILYYALQKITEEIVKMTIKLNVFILKKNNIFPKTYRHSFIKIGEYFDMEKIRIEELANTAKFRNTIAHDYMEMDEEEFIKGARKIVNIYPEYLKKLYNRLKD